MEIPSNSTRITPTDHGTIVFSSALIGMGALFLLFENHVLPVDFVLRYWPVGLIVAGVFRILEP
jgi:hypothetical protein